MNIERRGLVLATAVVLSLLAWADAGHAQVKHVILMIGDGDGYNCWRAASMYQGRWDAAKQRSNQVYESPGWNALACSTYPLTTASKPSGKNVQDAKLIYDPGNAWSTAPDQEAVTVGKETKQVEVPAGYKWLKARYTDSAAAATALSTGKKTYNAGINWSDLDKPLGPTASELAKACGKSVGIVTNVQWSHATPAGLSHAHVVHRDKYEDIAQQMLAGDVLDVIMGCGNPDYDDNGQPRKKKIFKYVGGEETWQKIEKARRQPEGLYHGFRPVSTKAEFEALLNAPTPRRILGTAQVAQTLQQARSAAKVAKTTTDASDTTEQDTSTAAPPGPPYKQPFLTTVPSLKTMTLGALRVLEANPQGLFLMVEGGAIDWANHNNQAGRMIEEQVSFVETIEAVVTWVETHSNWDETLLIITADHETGLLWGPDSKQQAFDPLVDHGAGQLPGLAYNFKSHTNSLVPLFAKGAGSGAFTGLVVGTDPVRGPYVTNTAVAEVMRRAFTAAKPAAAEKAKLN